MQHVNDRGNYIGKELSVNSVYFLISLSVNLKGL